MRCVSYTRMVPWEGLGQNVSIAEQNEMISAYLRGKTGWTLKRKYSDRGHRPDAICALDRLLKDGMERKFECVLVAAVHCCADSLRTARMVLLETFFMAGIDFVVVEDSFESMGKTAMEATNYFTEKYREMHREISKTWRMKERNRFVPGNSVPYGYKRRPNGDGLEKDETVRRYVEEIFRQSQEGRTPAEIAEWLNQEAVDTPYVYRRRQQGYPTVEEVCWNSRKVKKIMESPVYAGHLVNKQKEIVVRDCHEAYLAEETSRNLAVARNDGTGRRAGIKIKMPESVWADTIRREQAAAAVVRQNLLAGIGEAEKRRRKEELCGQLRQAVEPLLQKRRILYEKYCAGELGEATYRESEIQIYRKLEEVENAVQEIVAETKRLERAYSLQNPWLLYLGEKAASSPLSQKRLKKLREWKHFFAEDMFEIHEGQCAEGDKDGEKKQKRVDDRECSERESRGNTDGSVWAIVGGK